MKLLHLVTGSAVLAGAIAAATAAPPAASINPLRVSMVAASAGIADFSGAIEITVTNTSSRTVRLPRWQLPSDFLQAELFTVSRDGRAVEYAGPMIKRGLPRAADFAVLRAGESYRAVVDLSAAYDLTRSGQYTVTFNAPLQHASLDGGSMLTHANGLPMSVRSAPLLLWVDGSDQLGVGTPTSPTASATARKPGAGGSVVVGGITYKGCTTTRTSTAGQAVNAARSYSENAKGYLNAGTVGSRYTTWFGAYTSSRYGTAKQHFAAIDAALDQSGGQVTINCACNQNYYAYVYPNRPYEIFVCDAFWSAPMTGTDSKAGTLVHEMSHFDVVANTDDVVYGQTGAKNLATSNPTSALNNADNHEYFAENTPAGN